MRQHQKIIFLLLLVTPSVVFAQNEAKVEYYKNIQLQQWLPNDHTIEGWDWSLPADARPAPHGFISSDLGPVKKFPGNRVDRIDFQWKDIEPTEGVYKFDLIRNKISEARQNGYKGVAIYIKGTVWETRFFKWEDSSVLKPKHGEAPNWENAKMIYSRTSQGSAPRWFSKYNIPKVEEEMTKNNADPFQIVNLNIYHPEYQSRYVKLVEAFGKSGILDMPEVAFCYMNYKSRTHGEEGPGTDPDDPNWPIYRERMKAWSDAAGKKNSGKITFSGHGGKNLELALDTFHFGQRNGFVEMYLLHCDNEQLGITLDRNGYMHVNEDLPAIKENRVWGDENEEYPKRWVVRFGPLETFPHRYRESELRALQMRRNFIWEANESIDPHLTAYLGMSLGQKIETTRDVWCYLRESYVKRNYGRERGEETPVKNFERWLIQRDTLDAVTAPARKVMHGTFGFLRPAMFNTYVKDKQYDFTARKGKKIGFFIDERFLNAKGYAIKVTYWDNADFKIFYQTVGDYKTLTLKTTGDDRLKTATFFINDLSKNQKGDFDIYIQSGTGAEIAFVRVVKL